MVVTSGLMSFEMGYYTISLRGPKQWTHRSRANAGMRNIAAITIQQTYCATADISLSAQLRGNFIAIMKLEILTTPRFTQKSMISRHSDYASKAKKWSLWLVHHFSLQSLLSRGHG